MARMHVNIASSTMHVKALAVNEGFQFSLVVGTPPQLIPVIVVCVHIGIVVADVVVQAPCSYCPVQDVAIPMGAAFSGDEVPLVLGPVINHMHDQPPVLQCLIPTLPPKLLVMHPPLSAATYNH
jgi:hypothetical protein